jgi:tetratricopeptide (TPR) repeat protein
VRTAAVIVLLAVTTAHATPSQDLDRGRKSFRSRDWQSAIEVISPLLYPDVVLARQEDAIEAHILIGAANFEIGNSDRATDEFTRALRIDPDRSIGTLMFSEGAVRLFDRTKEDVRARLEHDAERKRLAEAAERLEAYRKSLVVYEARPFYLNFMPFGLAQFTQDRDGMGTLMAIGQGSTFLASVGIFGYLVGTYGFESNAVPLTNGPRVRRLQQVEIGTGIAFFAFYAWGVYDAIRHHKSRQQVQGDDSLIPPELLDPTKAKKPPPKTSLRDRLRIGPMVTPTGVGIGIGWEN